MAVRPTRLFLLHASSCAVCPRLNYDRVLLIVLHNFPG